VAAFAMNMLIGGKVEKHSYKGLQDMKLNFKFVSFIFELFHYITNLEAACFSDMLAAVHFSMIINISRHCEI
jgi:hypothetical protein